MQFYSKTWPIVCQLYFTKQNLLWGHVGIDVFEQPMQKWIKFLLFWSLSVVKLKINMSDTIWESMFMAVSVSGYVTK